MSSLAARINKLYTGAVSRVTSVVSVYKKEELIKQKRFGNNKEKVIEIVVRF